MKQIINYGFIQLKEIENLVEELFNDHEFTRDCDGLISDGDDDFDEWKIKLKTGVELGIKWDASGYTKTTPSTYLDPPEYYEKIEVEYYAFIIDADGETGEDCFYNSEYLIES